MAARGNETGVADRNQVMSTETCALTQVDLIGLLPLMPRARSTGAFTPTPSLNGKPVASGIPFARVASDQRFFQVGDREFHVGGKGLDTFMAESFFNMPQVCAVADKFRGERAPEGMCGHVDR